MIKRDKIIITSGEFNNITYSDIKYLKACKSKGDWLVVGLYSDMFLNMNRTGEIITFEKRKEVLQSLFMVDEIFRYNDIDGTCCNLLKLVKFCYPMSELTYISDIDMHNTPESKIRGITFETLSKECF
jgi:bifunctional ADP-heptose synthase (sugar kinase/adenylyltransferase)